ncbi:hypothetical protein U1Q18_027181 [Sarracenia purpurea var. burkii]
MDVAKGKETKNLFQKTWERCRSIRRRGRQKSPSNNPTVFPKSKSRLCTAAAAGAKSPEDEKRSSSSTTTGSHRVAPGGCFSVYVGPERQRFVMMAKRANHPLFRMLLEEAETEYGYRNDGPLLLPCAVDIFYKVLAEMEGKEISPPPSSGLAYGCCRPFRRWRHLGTRILTRVMDHTRF